MKTTFDKVFTSAQAAVLAARARLAIGRIRYKDWQFQIDQNGDCVTLRVSFSAPDADSSRVELQQGREFLLNPAMTVSDIVRTAFMAVLTAEEHEVREQFLYRNAAVFGPHQNVEALVSAVR